MTDKPSIRELSDGARQFVRENQAYLIDYARPLLIPMLLAEALQRIGPLYSKPLVGFAAIITSYFSACLILAWHRASLLGPRREHKVNPFILKPGEGKFVGIFFAIMLVTILTAVVGFVPVVAIAVRLHAPGLVLTLVGIGAIVLSMRFMFMLPARSVNAPSSWGDAWRISQGLVWRLAVASLRSCIWLVLLVAIIAFTAVIVLDLIHLISFDEQGELVWTLPGAVAMFAIEGIPVVIINFVILARGVTVLSRLYQWSVQNRPQPPEHAA